MRRIPLYTFPFFVLGASLPLACSDGAILFGSGGASSSSSSGTTTIATTTTTSTSSSSGSPCTNPETDCQSSGTKCVTVTCSATHTCASTNAAAGTPCADDGGKVCDGTGHCLPCNGDSDCAAPDVCKGGACVSPSCTDGKKDGTETDVDCGGTLCPPCGNDGTCAGDTDCKSGFCSTGTCAPCSQDTNCASGNYCSGQGAGAVCAPQGPAGATCTAAAACQSGFCTDGVCCTSACNGTCDVCGPGGTCGVEAAGANNANHPCVGGVCTGSPANACVQCVDSSSCSAPKGVCGANDTCVQCTAANSTACAGATPVCDTTADAQANTCVACNVNSNCSGGACDAHTCDLGNMVSPFAGGPMVTAPPCSGNLVSAANAACAAAFAGTHWCTANDANGAGTYHTNACGGANFQFNGGVTCAGNEWSTDIATGCVGGVVGTSVQPYVMAGAKHEIDCCN